MAEKRRPSELKKGLRPIVIRASVGDLWDRHQFVIDNLLRGDWAGVRAFRFFEDEDEGLNIFSPEFDAYIYLFENEQDEIQFRLAFEHETHFSAEIAQKHIDSWN